MMAHSRSIKQIMNNMSIKKYRIVAVFIICMLSISISRAATPVASSEHVWNLENADIKNVISEVSKETGKTFIVDPKVNGKLSIVSTKSLSSAEVYQVFLSGLSVLGYSVIPTGTKNVYKVMPTNLSTKQGLPVANQYHPGSGDQLVVRVVPIKNVSATKLVPALRPMLPATASISAYQATNTLIIVGTANNISQILGVIHHVDKANNRSVEVLQLQHANAADVAQALAGIMKNDQSSGVATIEADEHTNSVLVSGSLNARLKMRTIVAQLDRPTPAGFGGDTQVIQLHYLQAKNLAKVLDSIVKANKKSNTSQKNNEQQLIGIVAEPSSNSLIITAPPAMMNNLRQVVAKLDSRPSQVLVEAAIVEVDEGHLKALGVQWGTYSNEDLSQGNSSSSSSTGSGFGTGSLPQQGFNLGVGVIKNGDFREIITMLGNDVNTNILSTPSVVVLDNQTAKIAVGKTLSIQSGSYANSSGVNSVEPFNTFERQDIGLHLYVTPQISKDNGVELLIDQGNETLEDPSNPGTTPVTNNTSLKTSVLVNNGDILVLGGLISNTQAKNTVKVPIVSDIPLVGRLFQYKTTITEKRNLMIFLKPIILSNKSLNLYVTGQKYDYMRSQQSIASAGADQNLQTPGVLPAWNKEVKLPSPFSANGQ